MKPIQKAMWTALRRKKQFVLVGEPLQRTHLDQVLQFWQPGQKVVSADFEATTDNSSGRMLGLVWAEVSKRLPPALGKLASSAICPQVIEYPPSDGFRLTEFVKKPSSRKGCSELHMTFDEGPFIACESPTPFLQLNGQLMGSPLSFPLLCIENFAVLWASLEHYLGRNISPDEVHCLVNGDDLLFLGSDKMVETWKITARSCGFLPSLGKNFVSDRFCQLNSELFALRSSAQGGMEADGPIPYLNMGLVRGRGKGMEVEKVSEFFHYEADSDNYDPEMDCLLNCGGVTERLLYYGKGFEDQWLTAYWVASGEKLERVFPRWLINVPRQHGGAGLPELKDYTRRQRDWIMAHPKGYDLVSRSVDRPSHRFPDLFGAYEQGSFGAPVVHVCHQFVRRRVQEEVRLFLKGVKRSVPLDHSEHYSLASCRVSLDPRLYFSRIRAMHKLFESEVLGLGCC